MGDEAKKEGRQTPDETKPVELSNEELETVAGGRKAGEKPLEYLVVTMKEALISGASSNTK